MSKLIDLSGQRFGFWMATARGKNSNSGQTQWMCTCECGIQKLVTTNSLRSYNSTSCGCNQSHNLIKKRDDLIKDDIIKDLIISYLINKQDNLL
jgi:S-ribosylhomocysteine lyase LuxS involved in autoinducer biosynthesis